MATLVLTTVGGAIGGPIGAAVGAVLGNQIDRAVLSPTKPRVGPRLTDLAVQTSRYGEQVPRVFGTMRVAGCVIWSTDLIETRSKSRGGKGQPSTTSYSYAASFAVALSGRAASGVARIWADGKLLRGAAGDWKSKLGAFRFHTGDEAQLPDPLLASAVGTAPAHRGTAYAVFENLQLADFGNRIPSLSFELIADGTSVGAIACEIGRDAGLESDLADPIGGFAASGSSVGGALEVLARIGGAEPVPRGSALALQSAHGAAWPVAADLETSWTRAPVDTVPRTLMVSHYEPARDYQLGMQTARRPGAGWRDEAVDLPVVLDAGAARMLAERLLLRVEVEAESAEVIAAIDAIALAPGDMVALPGDPRRWRVTRSALEHGCVRLTLRPLARQVAVTMAADPGAPPPVLDQPAGDTIVEAFELPPLGDVLPDAPQLLVAACGTAPGWRTAALAVSVDGGTSWTPAGAAAAPAVIGRLTVPLPLAGAALVDRRNAIEVELAHGEMDLMSAGSAALDAGANLALVGDELVQFGAAERIAPRRWRLSTLWRGRRATPVAAHAVGARFVLIEEDALAALSLPGRVPGDPVQVFASGVADAGATASLALNGASVAPPPPALIVPMPQPDGGALIGWRRRSRRGWRWQDGVDAPLVEEREVYRVTITSALGGRTFTTELPTGEVTASERAAGPVSVSVSQLGTLGASIAATLTI